MRVCCVAFCQHAHVLRETVLLEDALSHSVMLQDSIRDYLRLRAVRDNGQDLSKVAA